MRNTANESQSESTTQNSSVANVGHRRHIDRWVNFVVSVAILAACLYGYTLLGERKRPPRMQPAKSDFTQVTSETLVVQTDPVRIETNGLVVPVREIRLATEVAGRVVEQSENLRTGRMVEVGELLIRLDKTEFELEVSRLNAQAAQEAAEVASIAVSIENTRQLIDLAKRQVSISQGELKRVDRLFESQAISPSEVDTLKRGDLTAQSTLVEQDNRRRELLAQRALVVEKQALTKVLLQRAHLDLTRCEVNSPIRGRVVASSVEEQSFVGVGATFVTIEDTSSAEVRTSLTADQMVWVTSSAPDGTVGTTNLEDDRVLPVTATISYNFGDETYQWPATLARIDGAGIDLQTRTYPCLFRVTDPESLGTTGRPKRLTRGMFVAVSIEIRPQQQLFTVPESAIRPGNRVWLKVDDRLRIVPVNVVGRANDRVVIDLVTNSEVAKSISLASVIVSPISEPSEGMAVSSAAPNRGPSPQLGGQTKVPSATSVEGNAEVSEAGTRTFDAASGAVQ